MCGCGNSMIQSNSSNIVNNICSYGLDYYQALLIKVNNQLLHDPLFSLYTNVVQSQINTYNKSCNQYESWTQQKIVPLLT